MFMRNMIPKISITFLYIVNSFFKVQEIKMSVLCQEDFKGEGGRLKGEGGRLKDFTMGDLFLTEGTERGDRVIIFCSSHHVNYAPANYENMCQFLSQPPLTPPTWRGI